MIFFTADLHFGHANIIKYCNRPFECAHDMNMALIDNWNNVVQDSDSVYVLGDFSFRKPAFFAEQLKGKKYLVLGNHDRRKEAKSAVEQGFFEWAEDYFELKTPNNPLIVLSHYAKRVWNRSHYGSIHLYGHSHGTLPPYKNSFDVGVDCWNFTPISLNQVFEVIRGLNKEE